MKNVSKRQTLTDLILPTFLVLYGMALWRTNEQLLKSLEQLYKASTHLLFMEVHSVPILFSAGGANSLTSKANVLLCMTPTMSSFTVTEIFMFLSIC